MICSISCKQNYVKGTDSSKIIENIRVLNLFVFIIIYVIEGLYHSIFNNGCVTATYQIPENTTVGSY